jgi:hypothetical protein
MIPSAYRERTRAVSPTVSPRPSCRSREERNMASPPSWNIPASKETRVRVEDFSKIIARVFPDSALRQRTGSRLTRAARSSRPRISAGVQSFSLT